MKERLIEVLAIPGILLGFLVMYGVLQNVYFMFFFWGLIVLLYPLIVIAVADTNTMFYVIVCVFLCGTLAICIPVAQYQMFARYNPRKIDRLNYFYTHPRRMMLAIGETIVLLSSLVSLMIADILIVLQKMVRT